MIYGCSFCRKRHHTFHAKKTISCNGEMVLVQYTRMKWYTQNPEYHASACMKQPFYGAFFMLILQPINYTSSIGQKNERANEWSKRSCVSVCESEWERERARARKGISKCCDIRYIYTKCLNATYSYTQWCSVTRFYHFRYYGRIFVDNSLSHYFRFLHSARLLIRPHSLSLFVFHISKVFTFAYDVTHWEKLFFFNFLLTISTFRLNRTVNNLKDAKGETTEKEREKKVTDKLGTQNEEELT